MEKERLEIDKTGRLKIEPEFEVPTELASYLEKVERLWPPKPAVQPVTDNQGQVIAQPVPFPQAVKIKLPLTKEELIVGLRQPIETALRWLAEQWFRVIKIAVRWRLPVRWSK